MSAELVNHLATVYLNHDDIDIKEASLLLVSGILSLDGQSYTKEEVSESLTKALPPLLQYALQPDIPEEVKTSIARIANFVQ